MSDFRWLALASLLAMALAFFAGVRLVFARPARRHRYRATLTSGTVLAAEALGIAATRVPAGRMWAAAALFGLSLGLFVWAASVNRHRPLALAFSDHPPMHVQTRGPYAFVRHPFYLSYLLTFLGGWIATGAPWVGLFVLAGFVTYWAAARREEARFREGPLGASYGRYASRVAMFVPRPWP